MISFVSLQEERMICCFPFPPCFHLHRRASIISRIFSYFFFFNRGLIFNKQFISPQRDDPLFVTCCTRYQIFFSFIFYTLLEISFAKGGRGFKLFKRIGKRPRCLSNRSWLCIFQKAEKKSIFKGDVLVFFKFCFSVQILIFPEFGDKNLLKVINPKFSIRGQGS